MDAVWIVGVVLAPNQIEALRWLMALGGVLCFVGFVFTCIADDYDFTSRKDK